MVRLGVVEPVAHRRAVGCGGGCRPTRRRLPPRPGRGRTGTTGSVAEPLAKYEGYYRTMLRDRRDYIAQLRRFDVQPYTETLEGGGPVSNLLIDFTTVNQINKCAPPGELGGDAK